MGQLPFSIINTVRRQSQREHPAARRRHLGGHLDGAGFLTSDVQIAQIARQLFSLCGTRFVCCPPFEDDHERHVDDDRSTMPIVLCPSLLISRGNRVADEPRYASWNNLRHRQCTAL